MGNVCLPVDAMWAVRPPGGLTPITEGLAGVVAGSRLPDAVCAQDFVSDVAVRRIHVVTT